MPIVIREIVIKTEVKFNSENQKSNEHKENFEQLRVQLLAECKKMLKDQSERKKDEDKKLQKYVYYTNEDYWVHK